MLKIYKDNQVDLHDITSVELVFENVMVMTVKPEDISLEMDDIHEEGKDERGYQKYLVEDMALTLENKPEALVNLPDFTEAGTTPEEILKYWSDLVWVELHYNDGETVICGADWKDKPGSEKTRNLYQQTEVVDGKLHVQVKYRAKFLDKPSMYVNKDYDLPDFIKADPDYADLFEEEVEIVKNPNFVMGKGTSYGQWGIRIEDEPKVHYEFMSFWHAYYEAKDMRSVCVWFCDEVAREIFPETIQENWFVPRNFEKDDMKISSEDLKAELSAKKTLKNLMDKFDLTLNEVKGHIFEFELKEEASYLLPADFNKVPDTFFVPDKDGYSRMFDREHGDSYLELLALEYAEWKKLDGTIKDIESFFTIKNIVNVHCWLNNHPSFWYKTEDWWETENGVEKATSAEVYRVDAETMKEMYYTEPDFDTRPSITKWFIEGGQHMLEPMGPYVKYGSTHGVDFALSAEGATYEEALVNFAKNLWKQQHGQLIAEEKHRNDYLRGLS